MTEKRSGILGRAGRNLWEFLRIIGSLAAVGAFVLIGLLLARSAMTHPGELGFQGTNTGTGVFIAIVYFLVGGPLLLLLFPSIWNPGKKDRQRQDKTNR